MARIRTIKPETFTSESIAALSLPARWTFVGLWTHVDDEGRTKDNAKIIRGAIWPNDEEAISSRDVEAHLIELERHGMLCRYPAEDGSRLMHVVNFKKHQVVNRASASKLNGCPIHDEGWQAPKDKPHGYVTDDSLNPHGELSEDSVPEVEQGTGNREEEQGKNVSSATATPPPDAATDREDVERICAHLAERIEANGSRRPAVTAKWRTAARLMLDADHRTEDDVHAAIDWSQNHEFWRGNVLSLPKLREKYDQLRLQAERQSRASPARNTGPDWAAAMARAEARDAAAEGRAPDYQPDDDLPLWKVLPA